MTCLCRRINSVAQMCDKPILLTIIAEGKGKRFSFAGRLFFANHNLDLDRTDVVKHQINTGESRPYKQQPRRISAYLIKEVIKCSSSPSQIVKVKKKDGSYRFSVDCLFVFWAVSSFSIIFYSYGDVTITDEGLQILT